MKGALIFLAVFIIVLLATIAYPDLPPGKQIYNALNVPTSDYPVLGIQLTTLIDAIFNGIIYGIVVWIIYTIADRATRKKPQLQPSKKS
jgi:predicted secreted protein